jgi:hypothetical protein
VIHEKFGFVLIEKNFHKSYIGFTWLTLDLRERDALFAIRFLAAKNI